MKQNHIKINISIQLKIFLFIYVGLLMGCKNKYNKIIKQYYENQDKKDIISIIKEDYFKSNNSNNYNELKNIMVFFIPGISMPINATKLFNVHNHVEAYSKLYLKDTIYCDRILKKGHSKWWGLVKTKFRKKIYKIIKNENIILPGRGLYSKYWHGKILFYQHEKRFNNIWVKRSYNLNIGYGKKNNNYKLIWEKNRVGIQECNKIYWLRPQQGVLLPICKYNQKTGYNAFILLKNLYSEGAIFYVQGASKILGRPYVNGWWKNIELNASFKNIIKKVREKDFKFVYLPHFLWAYRYSILPDKLESVLNDYLKTIINKNKKFCVIGVSGLIDPIKRFNFYELFKYKWIRISKGHGCIMVGSLGPSMNNIFKEHCFKEIEKIKIGLNTWVLFNKKGYVWGKCKNGELVCAPKGITWSPNSVVWIKCFPKKYEKVYYTLIKDV